MPQPQEKHIEINSELTDRLSSKNYLSEMEFFRYMRTIDSLKNVGIQSYLYALLYAAYEDKAKAISFFEESLTYGIDIAPNNYIAYLNTHGCFSEVKEVSTRLGRIIPDKSICYTAFQCSLLSGDREGALFFYSRFNKMVDSDEAKDMANRLAEAEHLMQDFKEKVGLSDREFQLLAETTISVMEDHGKNLDGVGYHTFPEERSYSYILMVNCSNPEKIADMNIDLAFALADKEELTGKLFSAWFKGVTGGDNAGIIY